jgi:hypothetical protein
VVVVGSLIEVIDESVQLVPHPFPSSGRCCSSLLGLKHRFAKFLEIGKTIVQRSLQVVFPFTESVPQLATSRDRDLVLLLRGQQGRGGHMVLVGDVGGDVFKASVEHAAEFQGTALS